MEQLDNVESIHPLTAAQKGLLYQSLLSSSHALYRTQSCEFLEGACNVGWLRSALQLLIDRHESLRCLFLYEGLDDPAAVVKERVELPWAEHDLTHQSDEAALAALDRIAEECLSNPLSIDVAPLFRVTLVHLSASRAYVIFDIHHLIFDGWSSRLFFSELQQIYSGLERGEPVALPDAGRFSDYAQWSFDQESFAVQAHWSDKLRGFERSTSLQLLTQSEDGTPQESCTDSSFQMSLDVTSTQALLELARITRVTLGVLCEAAWALTLSRYNDTDDVVIGITVNGRATALQSHEHTFGMFAHAMPLRLRCRENDTVEKWLDHVQQEKAALLSNDQVSLAEIHLASELPAGVDLFDALLVYQTFPESGEASATPLGLVNHRVHEFSPLPLLVNIFLSDSLDFRVLHDRQRLPEAAARQLLGHYLQVLSSLSNLPAGPQTLLSDVRLLSSQDERRLTQIWNRPVSWPRREETLHELFLAQANRTPMGIAIRMQNESLSFSELAEASRRVQEILIARGVKSGDRIAICIERGLAMYPGMLGAMMAGAVFVPIDPTYPVGRQEYMLADSGARLLITDTRTPHHFDGSAVPVLNLDDLANEPGLAARREGASSASDEQRGTAAYLMYTSGSTGMAKGVLGGHSATLNRFRWMWSTYPFTAGEVCCQKTSLSFVDSIWELFGPLLQGVPVQVLSDDQIQNAHRFVDALEHWQVSRVILLPSYLSVLLDTVDNLPQRLRRLSLCVVSGEPLLREVAELFLDTLPGCTLLNLYGSTEVSGDATARRIRRSDLSPAMPIGRPIDGCQVFVVNARQELMPPGATGELAVAGHGLSLGYHDEVGALNQERFVPNPFGEGLLYLTGDLGRHRPDGVLVHGGRKDAQIKILGHRIEPLEIERAIARHAGVRAALVHAPGGNRLHAFYRVRQGEHVDAISLEDYLRAQLPTHMVPQVLLPLDSFPRLPNGKIDRTALPHPDRESASRQVPPRTDTEQRVAAHWRDVLGGDVPSVYDNFVSCGGSSLSGMRFNARLYREFGQSVLPRMLLTANLAQIAAHIHPSDGLADESGLLGVDLMEPMFFASQDHRLFGVLHVPASPSMAPRAVLLCPSIGHEYMRLQRGYQILATELARRGYHVLRFDFFGFGDSDGQPSEASLSVWRHNVESAAQLLQQKSGAANIGIVGVRLGAAIMLQAGLATVNHAILWDPVCSGSEYLAHLAQLHGHAMRNLDRYRFRQRRSHAWERFGYTYSEALFNELAELDLAVGGSVSSPMDLVTTAGVIEHNLMGVDRVLELPVMRQHVVPDVSLWLDPDQASYLAFVYPVLRQIMSIIEGDGEAGGNGA